MSSTKIIEYSDRSILINDLDTDEYSLIWDAEPSENLKATGDIVPMQVDTNGTGFGAALYMASDGNYEEADADAAATMPCMALALETGTGSKNVLLKGFIRNDGWNWTSIGQPVYVSTGAGVLTQTKPAGAGDQVQIVGIATHADRIFFNPNYAIAEV
jgi:hypothetical protein